MTELETYLKPYFDLDKANTSILTDFFVKQTLPKNHYFTQPDKKCKKLSFISSGNIRTYNYVNGKEVTQWISSQGEFVTDLSSLIFDTNAQWHIQAITDCTIFTINRKDYQSLNKHISNWNHIEKLFLSKCFLIMEQRIFSFLSMTAEERYNQFMTFKASLFNEIPHHFIASLLGMSPETLSRIRKKTIS